MNAPTKPSAVITTELNSSVFTDQQQSSMIGAGAAVAEQDGTEAQAVETFVRILGKGPTLVMYSAAQALFQQGYHSVLPDMSPDALAKRTTRFFSEVLKAGGITKPKAETVTAQKKGAERAAKKAEMLADPRTTAQLADQIQAAYKALADHSAADPAALKKELRTLEKIQQVKKAPEDGALKAQLTVLRTSLAQAAKTCTSTEKLANAIRALN